jgi:hypothetical protein
MRRDSFVVATSSGIDKYRDRRTGTIREGTAGAVLTRSLEGSLERLGLDVPLLMRGHMYARAYRSPARAAEALAALEASPLKCTNCADCAVKCAMGFDVRRKVLDTIRTVDTPAAFRS